MNKEKLLAYFQEHYLSRQEVLFKLPLNYPIDTFWPELLNRRKAQATLLPLYNASGMTYWYVGRGPDGTAPVPAVSAVGGAVRGECGHAVGALEFLLIVQMGDEAL